MSEIVALVGSPSATSRTAAVAALMADRLSGLGHRVRVIAARDLPPAALLHADFTDPEIRAVLDALTGCDGVVVATPIYQAAYSGLLKTVLDMLPKGAFAGKAVLPVATAGSLAHLLAIDYSLRPVLSALGARHVVPGHLVLEHDLELTARGPVLTADAATALDAALATFTEALATPTRV